MSRHFQLLAVDGSARAGALQTAHGLVQTPAFMPVATLASVKALAPDDLLSLGAGILLSNAYHLMLRPGIELVSGAGGLHDFMGWHGPILTDSGGFQTFSLSRLKRVSEDGVAFRSHVDGSERFLSPESVVQGQAMLGVDVAMVLDECAPYDADGAQLRLAMERTHRWAARCRKSHDGRGQQLFAIVQGGVSTEMRLESAAALVPMDFDGYAVGGLSVGEPKADMRRIVSLMGDTLPADKPRYLMGVGSPEDLVECIALGMDMFDCSLPTRVARNGGLLTRAGRLNVTNAAFREAGGPVDPDCDCYACRGFSAAYLHHLFRAKELLAYRLASIHNLRFIMRLMSEARRAIIEGTFGAFRDRFIGGYRPTDEGVRRSQKDKWLAARRRGEG